ncbi:tRNA pseudouridine(38-40) synthase TruA [Chloroflexota bacterium]
MSVSGLAKTAKIVLTIEYDGTRYYGFQSQPDLPTIQGEIETAIGKMTGERLRVMSASRTDTGVHAIGQVVSFRTGSMLPMETFIRALNHYLPVDVAVKAACAVPDDFDVRRNAVSREYNYYIVSSLTRSPTWRCYAYQVGGRLNLEAMNRGCQILVGERDIASLGVTGEVGKRGTVRNIHRAEVVKKDNLIIFNIVANSFLRHQVRNTMGALIRVGLGKMETEELNNLLEARTPGLVGPRAPACGLCLMKVNYPAPFGGMFEEKRNEDI